MKLRHLAESAFASIAGFIEQHCKDNPSCTKESLGQAVAQKFGKPYGGVVSDMYYQLITKPAIEAKNKK